MIKLLALILLGVWIVAFAIPIATLVLTCVGICYIGRWLFRGGTT